MPQQEIRIFKVFELGVAPAPRYTFKRSPLTYAHIQIMASMENSVVLLKVVQNRKVP